MQENLKFISDPGFWVFTIYMTFVLWLVIFKPRRIYQGYEILNRALVKAIRDWGARAKGLEDTDNFGTVSDDCWVLHHTGNLERELYGMIVSGSIIEHLEYCKKYRTLIPQEFCNHNCEQVSADVGTLGYGPDPVEICVGCGRIVHLNEQ